MQTSLPKIGKIYISKHDPKDSIYVENVHVIEADEDEPESFCVEGRAPKDRGNPAADGIEIFGDEWIDHAYQLSTP